MTSLTISQLAKSAQVNIATIRFYERRHLLKESSRTASGYRLYSVEAVTRVRFIKKAKTLGFTLKEIKELLELQEKFDTQCQNLQHIAEHKLNIIAEKIVLLQNMQTSLKQIQQCCQQQKFDKQCSIVNCINSGGAC